MVAVLPGPRVPGKVSVSPTKLGNVVKVSDVTVKRARKVAQEFDSASTQEEYLAVLRKAKCLPRQVHLMVIDEMRFAAFRLGLDASTGLPKRRTITDRKGRSVEVTVVS